MLNLLTLTFRAYSVDMWISLFVYSLSIQMLIYSPFSGALIYFLEPSKFLFLRIRP